MDQAAEEGSTERTLAWDDDAIVAIDQCALPAVYRPLRPMSVDDVIVRLAIRGAPAIGVAGGVALAARARTRGRGRRRGGRARGRRAPGGGETDGGQPRVGRTSGARSAGGFSPWIDLRPYLPTGSAAAEHALWQRIPRSARVKILPGTAFACPEPGWFRLCHATDTSTVATGINRPIRALETS